MKTLLKIALFLLLPVLSFGQENLYYHNPTKVEYDSVKKVLAGTNNDTIRMAAYRQFAYYFSETQRDTALRFCELQLSIARKLKLKLWEADALETSGYMSAVLGNYPRALQIFFQAIKIAEDPATEKNIWHISAFTPTKNPRAGRLTVVARLHFDIGLLYMTQGYSGKQLEQFKEVEKIANENNDMEILSMVYTRTANYYYLQNKTDTALALLKKAYKLTELSSYKSYQGRVVLYIGRNYFKKKNYSLAKANILKAARINQEHNNYTYLTECYLSLTEVYLKLNNKDSSLYYASKSLSLSKITNDLATKGNAYSLLSAAFKLRNNIDSAFVYLGLAQTIGDSLNNIEKAHRFANVGFTEQLRLQQLEEEKTATRSKIRTYSLLAGLVVFFVIAIILYRNNRHKQKANAVLAETLSNLKSAQTQLVQREKMASLGELTAGIAHEIQNPLNFVNNFSDVNREIIDELKQELKRGNIEEAIAIAVDIQQNEEKISHHGKRADAIVKGMLQHSQSGSGAKQPTDINALADEYLQLSYHGLRSKDKSFNADLVTNFDAKLPKVNIISQDIGRVLLNLFNNAFYAVNQKSKTAGPDYKPEVSVTTSTGTGQVIIKVKDNGVGIPDAIKEKIMQPFFTTKPTGEGTGLGLSLTYDMVVKGHGGSIDVETHEGNYTTFTILLPLS